MIFQFLANAVLIVHVLFVAFVVAMLPCIFLGGALDWRWVRFFWLRFLHLVCIGIVSAEAWGRISCPLTTLEMWLRRQANLATYSGDFVEYWLHKALYWELPPWVFVSAYTLFLLLVIAAWILVHPIKRNVQVDKNS